MRLSHLQIYVLLSFMYHLSSYIHNSVFIGVYFCISFSYFALPLLYNAESIIQRINHARKEEEEEEDGENGVLADFRIYC